MDESPSRELVESVKVTVILRGLPPLAAKTKVSAEKLRQALAEAITSESWFQFTAENELGELVEIYLWHGDVAGLVTQPYTTRRVQPASGTNGGLLQ